MIEYRCGILQYTFVLKQNMHKKTSFDFDTSSWLLQVQSSRTGPLQQVVCVVGTRWHIYNWYS